MEKASGLSVSSVQRIWRAFGLQPHRMETFKLSTDPDFVAKVRDVVGLYVSPPEHAIVLCVDEKSQIQALDRSQPMLPMRPGQPGREILRATDRQKRSDAASIGAWPRSSAISIPSFATTMRIPGRSGGQNPQTISSPQSNASVDTMPMPEPENVANFWFRTLERDGIRLNHIRSWRSSLRVRLM